MIRFIIDKARLPGVLPAIRNVANAFRPAKELKCRRNFSSEVAAPAQSNAANLAKDVIVFKYENPRFFKLMNVFAISQFFFWGYLGHWSYTSLRDAPITNPDDSELGEELSWWRKINLGENKYKNTLAGACFLIGYGVIFVGWTFTLKSVRYLVALKDGKTISLVTYTPFGKNRIINVPLRYVSAQESRQTSKVYLPLKIKGRAFYYILDMKGEFKNTRLFDNTIGLSRKF